MSRGEADSSRRNGESERQRASSAGTSRPLFHVAPAAVPIALLAQARRPFALRPAVLPFAVRFGVRPVLIFGALGVALQDPILPRGPRRRLPASWCSVTSPRWRGLLLDCP